MVNYLGLLEKENALFTDKKPRASRNYSKLNQAEVISAKQSETDGVLENTLLNFRPNDSLTKREVEILGLIATGNTNKKIAQKLGRTERTVEYHRHRLAYKLGVKSAAGLIKCAIDMGIV